jgi:hypothetical protein
MTRTKILYDKETMRELIKAFRVTAPTVRDALACKTNSDLAQRIRKRALDMGCTPREYIQLLVDNMNQKDRGKGWTVGDCIEGNPALIDFNDVYCIDALSMIAEAFHTEYEIEGKAIHLRKAEKDKNNPLPLAYGKGNGLLSGIGRTNYKNRIAVLRVKTSDRNINRAAYGSKTLRMPKNHLVTYQGIRYITDATGSTITRETPLINAPVLPEETIDLTGIYP